MRRTLDRVGVGLIVAAIGWTVVVGQGGRKAPQPVVLGFVLAGVCYAAARLVSRRLGPEVVAGTVVGLGLVNVLWMHLIHYSNADQAVSVQACLAAVMVAVCVTDALPRQVAYGAAALLGATTLLGRSVFAIVVLGFVIGLLVLARKRSQPLLVVGAGAAAVGVLIACTALLPLPPGLDQLKTLEVRAAMWHEARDLLLEHPVSGVGPGRFEDVQRVSRDRDVRFAHSGALQQGAEQGVLGLVLLLGLLAWGYAACASADAGSPVPAIGAAALTALGLHASFDYILHFPLVFACAALLVGAATVPADQRVSRPAVAV